MLLPVFSLNIIFSHFALASPFAKDYLPVNQPESVEDSEGVEKMGDSSANVDLERFTRPQHPRISGLSVFIQWLPWVLVGSLVISNWFTWTALKSVTPDDEVFSESPKAHPFHNLSDTMRKAPARSAIKYKNLVFTAGIEGDVSPYQGWPTKENDALWEELHRCEERPMHSHHQK